MVRAIPLERREGMKAGRQFEIDHLGTARINDPTFAAELRKIIKDPTRPYVPFRQSLELAKRFQPGDPKNPAKDFLRELRLAIADRLGWDDTATLDQIGAYTAVGTPLDVWHGIDGFIAITEVGKPEKIVTLDLAVGEERVAEKEEYRKADIVVSDIPIPEEDEEAYLAKIELIADDVVRELRRKEKLN